MPLPDMVDSQAVGGESYELAPLSTVRRQLFLVHNKRILEGSPILSDTPDSSSSNHLGLRQLRQGEQEKEGST